jgi:hypothetical protein
MKNVFPGHTLGAVPKHRGNTSEFEGRIKAFSRNINERTPLTCLHGDTTSGFLDFGLASFLAAFAQK